MAKFDWLGFVVKLPMVVQGVMGIVQKIKGAKGAEKKAAVLEAIPESVSLVEFAAGRDLLNDPAIADLLSAYIDAEAIALRAREALKQGILAKAPADPIPAP